MTVRRVNKARRAVLLATCATMLMGLGLGAALADSLTLRGQRLALTVSGDTGVTIEADSDLHDAVHAIADDLGCLRAQSGTVVVVSTEGCGSKLDHLTLTVPAGLAMTLEMRGSGDVHVGDVAGELNAIMDSDGALSIASVNRLMLAVHGDGDASVAAVHGAADIQITSSGAVKLVDVAGLLHARLSGSGDLGVSNIHAAVADVDTAGSGDVTIGDGTISMLRAQTNGNGDISVAARVDVADLSAAGGGDIRLRGAIGKVLRRTSSGSSSIQVADNATELNDDLKGLNDHLRDVNDHLKNLKIDFPEHDSGTTTSSHGASFVHFIAGVAVLAMLFFVLRTVRRNGGWRAWRTPADATGEATHPGVLAVRETLLRLDGRLAQVETYVTSREFDLQRKFRDLDRH
jgi:hypothetical protein